VSGGTGINRKRLDILVKVVPDKLHEMKRPTNGIFFAKFEQNHLKIRIEVINIVIVVSTWSGRVLTIDFYT